VIEIVAVIKVIAKAVSPAAAEVVAAATAAKPALEIICRNRVSRAVHQESSGLTRRL